MRLDLTDAELDYVYRLLLARPMGEVEPLVLKVRAQAAPPKETTPAGSPEGVAKAPNGAGEGVDSLPLP